MKGYYGRPDATAEAIRDGWFRSGDLGKRDADGWYYIVDRSKDMIIRGGFNVYPREIEEVLMEHPAVSLAAVIGVPHESHGEEIKAVVIKEKDHDDVSEDDLVAWAKEQIAAYKYPRIVEFVDAAADDRDRQDPQARAVLMGRVIGLGIAVLLRARRRALDLPGPRVRRGQLDDRRPTRGRSSARSSPASGSRW